MWRPGFNDADRRTVVYCRVCSPGQKDGLASQVASMEGFCLARGLVVVHKDRLAWFGFDYVAARDGCQLVVANQESGSPRRELVEDLLAIVHSFSRRRYGPRRYEKTPRDELTGGIR